MKNENKSQKYDKLKPLRVMDKNQVHVDESFTCKVPACNCKTSNIYFAGYYHETALDSEGMCADCGYQPLWFPKFRKIEKGHGEWDTEAYSVVAPEKQLE